MVDRINLILRAKNLTSRQFAEEIGIQPSGMSHILSGRNRPSLDFVMKVVNRYPEIDIKWLTLGEGEMYVSPYSMPVAPMAPPAQPAIQQPEKVEYPEPEPNLFSAAEMSFGSESVMPEPEQNGTQETVEDSPIVAPKVEQNVPVAKIQDSEPLPEVKSEDVENRVFQSSVPAGAENQNLRQKRIVKVVILYDDHSFSEYYPE